MSCMEKYIKSANFADTGFSYTMSLISGKHKMVILYCLMEYEPVRFNEMKRYLGTITDKTLSSNLKELEADRLIVRKEYPQIPPKVEYSLSERGKSLMKVLDQLCIWGEENRLNPTSAFDTAEKMKDFGSFALFENTGALPHMENSKAFLENLNEFLNQSHIF